MVSTDSLTDIEQVVGSGFDDTVSGDENENVLEGGLGHDILDGRGGNDVLDGGEGIDTASYAEAGGRVEVDLGAGRAYQFGPAGTDAAGSILATDELANIERVVGSALDDALTGGADNDVLHGCGGDDVIASGAGLMNRVAGGVGSDVFAFGDELANGIVERDVILDYEALRDALDLGGHEIVRYAELDDAVRLRVGEDRDAIVVRGVDHFADITFVDLHDSVTTDVLI